MYMKNDETNLCEEEEVEEEGGSKRRERHKI